MAVVDLLELPAATPPYTGWAGLDLGEKTIGVAVCDQSLNSPTTHTDFATTPGGRRNVATTTSSVLFGASPDVVTVT